MAARKAFKVECKEEGRGRATRESFATLAEARDYIRDRWQGVEYKDGNEGFHTDYSTYKCIGFTLADIGKSRWSDGWFEWDWLDLDAKACDVCEGDCGKTSEYCLNPLAAKPNPLADQLYAAFERYDAKQHEEAEPPPF